MQTAFDRSIPPVPGTPKDVHFPEYFETTLPNGLTLIVYERHELPTVTVNVVIRGGSSHDAGMPGLASMMGELLTKGTPTRTASNVVEEIEFLGGSIGSGAGWDSCSSGITILSRFLDKALAVLADVTMHPSFPAEELDRLREQRLAHIMQRKSNPSSLAMTQFQRAVFGSHPYAQPAEGTEDTVRTVTPAMIADFHRRFFIPNNAFIIAVGDVSPAAMEPLVAELFGGWEPGTPPAPIEQEIAEPQGITVHVVDRPSAVQSSIVVGHAGIARSNPDYIAASIVNTILGGYFGSRLNLNLREHKGYTYGAFSRFDARLMPGPFIAGADVRNEVTDLAVDEFIREITRLVQEPVGGEELSNVKSYVTGNFPIQIETPVQVAQRIINLELYGLGRTYYNTFNSRVLALTPDDILRTARTYLHPERLVIVAAGRGTLLRNTLARFGTVDVFDTDGTLIPNL